MLGELPDHKVMFMRFLAECGDEAGARTRFQRLVTDLVLVKIPTASEVSFPSGSDWGIDTYAGSLDGDVAVWQSKFFMSWGKTQQGEIRSSFKQVTQKAAEQGFKVTAWTLCVPSILPPDQQKWFDGWRGRQFNVTGIRIELWNGVHIRNILQQVDARHLREQYFPTQQRPVTEIPLAQLVDPEVLSGSLFVVQLELAGHLETDAAKAFFFAAEAMARDVASRKVQPEMSALFEAELETHGVWEAAYNSKAPVASRDGLMIGLVQEVNRDVAQLPSSADLRLRPAHRRGLIHRLVEGSQAGWVTNWRDIASSHEGTPAVAALEGSGHLSVPSTGTPSSEEEQRD